MLKYKWSRDVRQNDNFIQQKNQVQDTSFYRLGQPSLVIHGLMLLGPMVQSSFTFWIAPPLSLYVSYRRFTRANAHRQDQLWMHRCSDWRVRGSVHGNKHGRIHLLGNQLICCNSVGRLIFGSVWPEVSKWLCWKYCNKADLEYTPQVTRRDKSRVSVNRTSCRL